MEIASTLYSELQRQESTSIGSTSIWQVFFLRSHFNLFFSRSNGQLGRYLRFVFGYVCPVLYWDLFLGSSNHLWGHRSLSTQTRQKHQIISFKQTFSTLLNSMSFHSWYPTFPRIFFKLVGHVIRVFFSCIKRVTSNWNFFVSLKKKMIEIKLRFF